MGYVFAFDRLLDANIADVTDLAALHLDGKYGYCMCVALRTENTPRYNVWTKGTGVWRQALDAKAWFVVKKTS